MSGGWCPWLAMLPGSILGNLEGTSASTRGQHEKGSETRLRSVLRGYPGTSGGEEALWGCQGPGEEAERGMARRGHMQVTRPKGEKQLHQETK